MTVALPLSAGKISIELSFFKSFIALYSSVVILEGGLALVSAPMMFIRASSASEDGTLSYFMSYGMVGCKRQVFICVRLLTKNGSG